MFSLPHNIKNDCLQILTTFQNISFKRSGILKKNLFTIKKMHITINKIEQLILTFNTNKKIQKKLENAISSLNNNNINQATLVFICFDILPLWNKLLEGKISPLLDYIFINVRHSPHFLSLEAKLFLFIKENLVFEKNDNLVLFLQDLIAEPGAGIELLSEAVI